MPEGDASASTATRPPDQPAAELRPPDQHVASVWPVVIGPAVIITVAAIGGYLAGLVGFPAGEIVTLTLGVIVAAVLTGLVAYRILGRKGSWMIALAAGLAGVLLLGLGMLRVRDIQPDTQAATSTPQAPSGTPPAGPSRINAGRQFTQETIGDFRDFRGADLRGAQLIHLDLRGIDFSGADAAGASFDGSRLDRAVFRGADLGGAVLRNTCLRHTVLTGADLTGASAAGADVSGADITEAETHRAEWPSLNATSTACG